MLGIIYDCNVYDFVHSFGLQQNVDYRISGMPSPLLAFGLFPT